ncbi:MAG: hypothetical protein F4Z57_20375 [Gemmatimonadetes bacterium]|nr:hypothetical protein [Gemmatimonadota bacterium]MYC69650.1 hypothetical protein [Gemmatimonadota bacterium]
MDVNEYKRRERKKVISGHKGTIKGILRGKFGSRCWGCGQEKDKLQVDHINPVFGGGGDRRKVKMGNAALLFFKSRITRHIPPLFLQFF